MIINDLIKTYNVQTNIHKKLKEHKLELIMPPVENYEYTKDEGKHIFTSKTGNMTDTIIIDDIDKSISISKEPHDDKPAQFYQIWEDGSKIFS